jgi:hypothetical protein
MARIRVGRWAWLVVPALLAAVLAMSACGGGGGGEGEGTPQATKAAGETPALKRSQESPIQRSSSDLTCP